MGEPHPGLTDDRCAPVKGCPFSADERATHADQDVPLDLQRKVALIRRNRHKPTFALAWWSLCVSGIGMFISIFGIAIASASLYFQFLDRRHVLSVVVSQIEANKNQITFGVIIKNDGDYTEVITGGDVLLDSSPNDVGSMAHSLEHCFQPIVIEAKHATHNFYTINLLPDDFKLLSGKEHNMRFLTISFDALTPDGSQASLPLILGTLKFDPAIRRLTELDLPNSVRTFDLSKQKGTSGMGVQGVRDDDAQSATVRAYTCQRKPEDIT